MRFKGTELVLIILSFLVIYIIWGTTFLGVRLAIDSIPPLLMAGFRYGLAGVILYLTSLLWDTSRPTWKQLINATIGGVLFIGFGTGCMAWSLQYIDTGITAMIIAGQPLITLFMVWVVFKRPPVLSSYVGIVLGFVGMFLLVFQNQITTEQSSVLGVLVLFFGMLCWGYGSVFIQKSELPKGQAQNTSIQMMMGGLAIVLVSFLIGEYKTFALNQVTTTSAWAFVYLIFFGSILGFSCFNYLLKRISAEKVATSTYINPIVATILGWWILNEVITQQSILAALFMLTGVFFINVDVLALIKKRRLKIMKSRS